MKELHDLQAMGLANDEAFTFENAKGETRFVQKGHENEQLAKMTPLSDRKFYRHQGYDPKGKSLLEIASELRLPTIYEDPIKYNNHYNSHVKALYLEDGTLLDVVKENWKVIQPIEIVGLFLEYCEGVKLEIEKVGVFKHERTKDNEKGLIDAKQTYSIFISSRLNQDYSVSESDLITGKLIFKCPYINGQGYTTGITSLRQACTNGLYMPVRLAKKTVSHLGSLKQTELLKVWKKSRTLWVENKNQNILFADTECTEMEAVLSLVSTFSTVDQHKQIAAQALYELRHGGEIDAINSIYFSSFWDKECKLVRECIEMFKHGTYTGFTQGTKSTMWGLLNCVTEYINWNGKQRESALASLLGGSKANQIQKFQRQLVSLTVIKREKIAQKVSVIV